MNKVALLPLSFALLAPAFTAQAKPAPYTGADDSGTYQCTGKDHHEGFSKYYFEPEFKGGNFGFERCTQR